MYSLLGYRNTINFPIVAIDFYMLILLSVILLNALISSKDFFFFFFEIPWDFYVDHNGICK